MFDRKPQSEVNIEAITARLLRTLEQLQGKLEFGNVRYNPRQFPSDKAKSAAWCVEYDYPSTSVYSRAIVMSKPEGIWVRTENGMDLQQWYETGHRTSLIRPGTIADTQEATLQRFEEFLKRIPQERQEAVRMYSIQWARRVLADERKMATHTEPERRIVYQRAGWNK